MTRATTSLLISLTMAVAACGRGSPAAPAPSFAPLAPLSDEARLFYDNGGGIRDSAQLVIRDSASFRDVWHRATAAQSNPAALPMVNFSRDMVIMVAGGRMSPADQLHVDSAGVRRESTASGKQQNVLAIVYTISQACRKFNGDAYPVEIVRVQRYAGEVRFVAHRVRGSDCR